MSVNGRPTQNPIVYKDPHGVHTQLKGLSTVSKPNPRRLRPRYEANLAARRSQRS